MTACRAAALTILLAFATGSPASAGQAEPVPDAAAPADPAGARETVADLVATIVDKAAALGVALGIDAPPIPQAALTAGIVASLPMLPPEDPRDWASGMAVDFVTDVVSNGPLQPNADGHVVLRDGLDCVSEDDSVRWAVVDFRRLDQPGLTGHQCTLTAMYDGSWAIRSVAVVEGGDRRLVSKYTMVVTVEPVAADAISLGEARLPANVTLARGIADYGVALLKQAETGRRTDPAEALERLARAAEVLGEP